MSLPNDDFETLSSFHALHAAAVRARRASPHSEETCRFFDELEPNLVVLSRQIRKGTYRPKPLRRFVIREPKRRVIAAAAFRDRITHHALCAILEPAFERTLTPHSFACRRNMGLHRAVLAGQRHLRHCTYVLKCDVRHYFETIDLQLLRSAVTNVIHNNRVLDLLDLIVDNGAVDWIEGRGIGLPIGNLTSQHLANFYLGAVDRWVLERISGGTYCRYMDDVLIFDNDKSRLWKLHDDLEDFLATKLRLTLKTEVSAVFKYTVGVPFLGMRIFRGTIRLSGPARRRLIRKLRANERDLATGRIDDDTYRAKVNGLLGYATGANTLALRRSVIFRE